MKKIFTLCVVAILCMASLNTQAQTSLRLDYDEMDNVYTQSNINWDYGAYLWNINKNYPNDSTFTLRFVSVLYDSLINFNYTTGAATTIPLPTSTVRLDSFQVYYNHIRNVTTSTDTIYMYVYDITQATITGTGVNQTLTAPWIWSDSIKITGSNNANSLGIPVGILSMLSKKPNITLPAGRSFGIYIEFRGNKSNSLQVVAGYRDQCGATCGAELAYNPGNSLYYINYAASSGITSGLYYDCNSSGAPTPGGCEYIEIQNFVLPAFVTVTTSGGATTPTVVTTAASSVTQNTATLNGTANANNNSTTVTFEWGLTTSYGNTVNGSPLTVTGSNTTNISAGISSLTASTTYHYRIKGVNSGGTSYGSDMTFTTQAAGGSCTPNGSVTSGMSPTSSNVPCITKTQSFSQTFTFAIPSSFTYQGVPVTVTSVQFDSIGNLPSGLTATFNQTPPTYAGGATGCFLVSGTTNAPCGQYEMPVYVTITVSLFGTPQSFSGKLSDMATTYGLAGFDPVFLRVIAAGDACPAVNSGQSTSYVAYGTCGGGSSISATISKTDVSCFGGSNGSATANATGGTNYSYAWSNGGNGQTISNLAAGNYTVTVTSGAQTAIATVTITQPTALSVSTSSTTSACSSNTGSATASATGGTPTYSYAWSNSGSGATISNIAAGNYTVTVTDTKNCSVSTSVIVSNPASFNLSVTTVNVNCFSQSTGSATAVTSGGSNFTYTWNVAGNGATISNLAAGTYTVTATDGNGCAKTASGTVTQPASALGVTTSSTQAACGQSNGTATAAPAGGTSPYAYLWSNSNTGISISNVAAGNYSVTVTDNKGCSASATVVVGSPASFTLSATNTAVTCYGQSTGSATAVTAGGSNFTYAWSNSGNTATINNLPAGTYTVTVTDGSGCVKTATTTVTQPANPLTVTANSTNSTCGGSTGTATATVTNNNGSPAYSWSPGNGTTQTISNLAAGIYTVTVTAGGCTATATTSVNNSNGPSVTIQKVDPTCFGATNGTASAIVSGGTSPYTYNWSNSATGFSVSGLSAGAYTLIVSDNSGCSAFGNVTLNQPNPLTLTETITNINCFGSQTGGVSVVTGGGTGPYAYTWSSGSSSSSTANQPAGSYSVTVTDSKSCTVTSTYVVTQPALLAVTTTSTPSAGTNGTATANVTGGTSPYNYSWNTTPPQNSATATSLAPGAYTVTVSDSKGCSATSSVNVGTVGINDIANIFTSFQVFPNPAADVINVAVETNGAYAVTIRITDVNGKVVYASNEFMEKTLNRGIDASAFNSGVYMVEAIGETGSLRKRVMIAH